MKKTLLLYAFLSLIFYSCNPEPDIIPLPPHEQVGEVSLSLSADTVTFSKMDSIARVTITIVNFSNLNKLSVVKKTEKVDTLINYLPSQIDSIYHYEYNVKEEDGKIFELEFIAFKKDDTIGASSKLLITDVSQPFNQVKLYLDNDTVIYNSEDKKILVPIRFENLSSLKELQVKWKDTDQLLAIIEQSEIREPYVFEYDIADVDPDRFHLTFNTIDQNNLQTSSVDLFVALEGIVLTNLVRLSRVTGKTLLGEKFLNPNRTDERWDLGGTDLGIMWEMEPGKVGIFFGDSYGKDWRTTEGGGPGIAGHWRSNVLAFSEDKNLDDGMKFNAMAVSKEGFAREIVYSAKQGTDFTSIPTAAIRANGVDYVHYFNLRTWDNWTTNYSSLYSSSDNGETWKSRKEVTFGTKSRFSMVGYGKKDGYVYMIGTPSGRMGKPYLARFLEEDILRKAEYAYWNGDRKEWVKNDENQATPLWDKNVGELSLMFHEKYQRWIVAYSAGEGDVHAMLYRDAKDITGPWTKAKMLVDGVDYPGLYGPYMHPVKNKEDKLYFNMSQWWPYNVFFMRVDMEVYQ